MSKNTTKAVATAGAAVAAAAVAHQASLPVADESAAQEPKAPADQVSQAEAERIAAEQAAQAEAERIAAEQAAQAEAERIAAEQAEVRTLLLRTEFVDGVRYPAGDVLKLARDRVKPLQDDGAIDPHPAAVTAAIERGAAVWSHAEQLAKQAAVDSQ